MIERLFRAADQSQADGAAKTRGLPGGPGRRGCPRSGLVCLVPLQTLPEFHDLGFSRGEARRQFRHAVPRAAIGAPHGGRVLCRERLRSDQQTHRARNEADGRHENSSFRQHDSSDGRSTRTRQGPTAIEEQPGHKHESKGQRRAEPGAQQTTATLEARRHC